MRKSILDEIWVDMAPEFRRARGLEPLAQEVIAAELKAGKGNRLSSERISKIVKYAISPASEKPKSRHPAEAPTVDRIIEQVSSCGLVPIDDLNELEEEQAAKGVQQTPRDYAAELARWSKPGSRQLRLYKDYLLLDPIGHGGMGDVFRAFHTKMDRLVAIKMLPSSAARQRGNIQRFDREIKTLAKLHHPNIVAAYDAGETEGTPYLVMEHVDGSDLAQLVSRVGRLSPRLALDFILQAAQGLAYAHDQGIVHRDVKPSNMLVDSQSTIKISDLGLASFSDYGKRGADDLTAPGTALGTYAFMAPEQAVDAEQADHRADIYGLGCTLYYLLIGRSPAEGYSNNERQTWHREGVIPSLQTLRPEIPEQLDATFQRMLAKAPADRQQSMKQVIEELKECHDLICAPSSSSTMDKVGLMLASHETNPARNMSTVTPQDKEPIGKEDSSGTVGQRLRSKWGVGIAALLILGVLPVFAWVVFVSPKNGLDPRHVDVNAPPLLTNSIGMKLMRIPLGEFMMGAPAGEAGSEDDERPQRRVTLTKPFYMGVYEVTREQYQLLMEPNDRAPLPPVAKDVPAAVNVAALPMGGVSWEQAVEFCRRLSDWPEERKQNRLYRLPTEAEWEYCCRAGTATAYSTGDDITQEQANYGAEWRPANTKFPGRPSLIEVGSYLPNEFGLYDMHGNVQEFCLDRYGEYHPDAATDPTGAKTGIQFVVRGGACTYMKSECRSANRNFKRANDKPNQYTGFRVVCVIED